jgi:hypothetical protein
VQFLGARPLARQDMICGAGLVLCCAVLCCAVLCCDVLCVVRAGAEHGRAREPEPAVGAHGGSGPPFCRLPAATHARVLPLGEPSRPQLSACFGVAD